MVLALLSAGFQSLPPLPTSKAGPSGADSSVGGFCTFWDPVGLSKELFCEAESFSCCCLNPQGVFNQWFEAFFACAAALGLHSLFCSPFIPLSLSACKCGTSWSASHALTGPPGADLPTPLYNLLPH